MNDSTKKCCYNCRYFSCDSYDFTVTGRLKKWHGQGKCSYPITWPKILPACLDFFRPPERWDVWSDDGLACPCFELSSDCPKGGNHVWGTDGQHSNEFCKKCFKTKPEKDTNEN